MLALIPLTLTLLVRALHRGTWGRWLAYGASQFLLLYTYPGGLYLLLVLNAVTALALWRPPPGHARARTAGAALAGGEPGGRHGLGAADAPQHDAAPGVLGHRDPGHPPALPGQRPRFPVGGPELARGIGGARSTRS